MEFHKLLTLMRINGVNRDADKKQEDAELIEVHEINNRLGRIESQLSEVTQQLSIQSEQLTVIGKDVHQTNTTVQQMDRILRKMKRSGFYKAFITSIVVMFGIIFLLMFVVGFARS